MDLLRLLATQHMFNSGSTNTIKVAVHALLLPSEHDLAMEEERDIPEFYLERRLNQMSCKKYCAETRNN